MKNGIGTQYIVTYKLKKRDGEQRNITNYAPNEKDNFSLLKTLREIEKTYRDKVINYKVSKNIIYWHNDILLEFDQNLSNGMAVYRGTKYNTDYVAVINTLNQTIEVLIENTPNFNEGGGSDFSVEYSPKSFKSF